MIWRQQVRETGSQRDRQSETGGQRQAVRDRRSETGSQRQDIRDRESETGCERQAVRDRESETGGQRQADVSASVKCISSVSTRSRCVDSTRLRPRPQKWFFSHNRKNMKHFAYKTLSTFFTWSCSFRSRTSVGATAGFHPVPQLEPLTAQEAKQKHQRNQNQAEEPVASSSFTS